MTPLRVMALAAVVMTPAAALANPNLERARAALDDLQFENAYGALEDAVRAGDNSVDDMVEIYGLLGEVAAALGREDEATDAFEMLLTIRPSHQLREGVSPKITGPFGEARARVRARKPLQFSCAIASKDPITVAVVVASNPLDIAAGAFVSAGDGDNREPLARNKAEVTLEIGQRAKLVGVTDEAGNRVAETSVARCSDETVAAVDEPPPPDASPGDDGDDGESILGNWMLWGGVAVAFGAAGGYFGLQAKSDVDELNEIYANSAQHEYSEAVEKEDSARRNALFANIGYAAAAGAAVVAGVLLVRSGDGKPAEREAVVAPTATGDGVGVVFAMPF